MGHPAGAAGPDLDLLLERAPIELEPVTLEHAQAARQTWRRFARGNHRPALNFGDCFAYALAEAAREPLLFKGQDFALTEIEPASFVRRPENTARVAQQSASPVRLSEKPRDRELYSPHLSDLPGSTNPLDL